MQLRRTRSMCDREPQLALPHGFDESEQQRGVAVLFPMQRVLTTPRTPGNASYARMEPSLRGHPVEGLPVHGMSEGGELHACNENINTSAWAAVNTFDLKNLPTSCQKC